MKLISCYVENFGNIKARDYDFERGLTSLCEHNGYGKTTLAAFLKAMFYGLKQTTARDKELGERARFYPFDGGKFGGNVLFEKGGSVYKIERFFGRKSATEDTLTIYRDGTLMPDCDDTGKEFFGIDEQSFLKTIFINSDDAESGATSDVSRMLNGFVDDADFDGAKKILERRLKEHKAFKGRGGAINDKHDEVLRLKEGIENKEKISDGLSEKYELRRALALEIAALEERQNSSRDNNLVLEKWRTYDGYAADAAAERERLNNLLAKYPDGIPDGEDIVALKRAAEGRSLARERLASSAFSAEKEQRLASLSARFSAGVPKEGEIASANDIAAAIIRLDAETANLERLLENGKNGKFASGVPDPAEIESYGEKLKSLREKRESPRKKTSNKIPLSIFAFAIALLAAGAGLLLVNPLAGGISLAVGAVGVLLALFIYFKMQLGFMKAPADKNDDTESEIKIFLARFGYYSGGGAEVDYNNLTRDLAAYEEGIKEREGYLKLLESKMAESRAAREKVVSFLAAYGFTGENAQLDLTRLGGLIAEYAALNEEKEGVCARAAASERELAECDEVIKELAGKYSFIADGNESTRAAEAERDAAEAVRLRESAQRLEKRAESYRAENGLETRPSCEEEDTGRIDSLLSKKRDELSLLDREISDDEGAAERLSELREELECAQEEENALKKKHELIGKTLELLERAEGNLKDRYVFPVRNSFLKYSELLEKVLGERVAFDKDFKVRFERGGELRSDSHLSAGQKSLCALCVRLALLDNMYKGELPFVIMDDPFVHLDDEHMQRAQSLIKELAKNRQLIYFCCHESRKIS